jgi:flagellar motor switch protein FliM
MSEVIRRKIDRARAPQAEGAPGADRAWRLALARASRDAMGLDLDFISLRVLRVGVAELLELAPERNLVSLLDGPEGGLGVLLLSPVLTSALIEMQTLGRLSGQTAPARKPTRIDAAMVAGIIDLALGEFDQTLSEEPDRTWAGGFRYASFLDDVRPLHLMLEEEVYRVLLAEISLAGGARTGQVILALPALGRGEWPVSLTDAGGSEAPSFAEALAEGVLAVDCRLDAVIGHLRLPLGRIMAFQPGEEVLLPMASLDAIGLETLTGQQVARARLGQNRGMRAIKIIEADAHRAAVSNGAALTGQPGGGGLDGLKTAMTGEPVGELRAAG